MVAAKIDAKITPPRIGLRLCANLGKPVSASSASISGKIALVARPIKNISAINGVCQTKNQIIACFLSESSFKVITRDTTCGWPATPRPPRKNAAIHNVAPNFSPDG